MINLYDDILYNFQKKVVEESRRAGKYGLGMEAGTGKTYTSLAIVQDRKKKKVLVICPTSKVEEGRIDLNENMGFDAKIINQSSKEKDEKIIKEFKEGGLVVGFARTGRRSILEKIDKDGIIIIDESHNMKNRTSTVGKGGVKASKLTNDVLLLSGTPIANEVGDGYNQIKIMGGDMKFTDFRDMFSNGREIRNGNVRGTQYIGVKNEKILHEALKAKSSFVEAKDVMELPEKVFTDMHLLHDKPKTYAKVKKHSVYKDKIIIETPGILFLRLRQLASGFIENIKNISRHKQTALEDLLDANTDNLLLFYNFNQELEDIKKVLEDKKIDYYQINGKVKDYTTRDSSKRFVILGQYGAAAEAIDGLQKDINRVLYYSPPLSSIDGIQSAKRVNRIGQNKTCFYYKFITKGTLEQSIYKTVEAGQNYTLKMFEDGKNSS